MIVLWDKFHPTEKKTNFPSNLEIIFKRSLRLEVVLFSGRFSPRNRISDGGHRNNPKRTERISGYPHLIHQENYGWWFRPKTSFTTYNPCNHSLWEVEENKQEIRRSPVVIRCLYIPLLTGFFHIPGGANFLG